MTFMPSLPISLIALGALALLALANWYVSGLSVERAPSQRPGVDRVDDFRGSAEGEADQFKQVA
jgi:hypothetical protein